MIEVSDLSASYGGIRALRGVSLSLGKGEMRALIGPNGAGKSTLLNCIMGVVPPHQGRIAFQGKSMIGLPTYKIVRLGLIQVPEGRQVLGALSVEENLVLGGVALGARKPRKNLIELVFSIFPLLEERRKQLAGSLSGGQQQMLAIGRALMGEPQVLLLDEPSLGLSPITTDQVFGSLVRLNREGISILLVEQNARLALAMTSYSYVIDQGRIAREGLSSVLANDPEIEALYLGGPLSKKSFLGRCMHGRQSTPSRTTRSLQYVAQSPSGKSQVKVGSTMINSLV